MELISMRSRGVLLAVALVALAAVASPSRNGSSVATNWTPIRTGVAA